MADSNRTFSQEEVNEIIRRALDDQLRHDRVLSHDDLVEVAAEAGIDRRALDEATMQLAQQRTQALIRQDEAREIAAERMIQLKQFGSSFVSLSVLCGFLYFTQTTYLGGAWFHWPLMGAGVILAFKLRHVIFPYDKVMKRRRQQEQQRERERRRAERDAWKQKIFSDGGKAITEGAKEFEKVVQTGVTALLKIAARKLEEHVEEQTKVPKKRNPTNWD
jgi:hypothetical protein